MLDRKTLDDQFRKRETAQKDIEEANEDIAGLAYPLVLDIFRTYQDNDFWPGRTSEEITLKIRVIYDLRFREEDIKAALKKLSSEEKILKVRMGPRTGYKITPAYDGRGKKISEVLQELKIKSSP